MRNGQRRWMWYALAFVATTALVSPADDIGAAERVRSAPWTKACSAFETAHQFVSESTLFCLRQQNQRTCDQQAKEFFESCRFSGDFERMSSRIHAKMLLVLALAGSKSTRDDSAS